MSIAVPNRFDFTIHLLCLAYELDRGSSQSRLTRRSQGLRSMQHSRSARYYAATNVIPNKESFRGKKEQGT